MGLVGIAQRPLIMANNIHELSDARPAPTDPPGGGGGDIGGRVSALEARLDYLATKEDVSEIKTLIATREATMLRWLIGLVGVSAISLLTILVRAFFP